MRARRPAKKTTPLVLQKLRELSIGMLDEKDLHKLVIDIQTKADGNFVVGLFAFEIIMMSIMCRELGASVAYLRARANDILVNMLDSTLGKEEDIEKVVAIVTNYLNAAPQEHENANHDADVPKDTAEPT